MGPSTQGCVIFKRRHGGAHGSQNRRPIARPGIEHQSAIPAPQFRQLNKPRQHHGLHQNTPGRERHIRIRVSPRRQALGQESFAGQCPKGREDTGVLHLIGPQLPINHEPPCAREIHYPVPSPLPRHL